MDMLLKLKTACGCTREITVGGRCLPFRYEIPIMQPPDLAMDAPAIPEGFERRRVFVLKESLNPGVGYYEEKI